MAYDIFVQHPVINFLLKFFINLLFTIDRFGFECLIILPVSSLHARFNFMFSVCFRLKFLHCLKPNKDRKGDQVSVVLADSQFDVDAVCSIFRDQRYELVPLLQEEDMPFNFFGDFRSGKHYDYRFFATGTTHNNNFVYLDDVRVTRFGSSMPDSSKMEDLNPEIYTSVIDFDLTKPRFPRSSALNRLALVMAAIGVSILRTSCSASSADAP